MKLDEAIKHARDKANEQKYYARFEKNNLMYQSCVKCAEEHEQLAKWLEELKQYRDLEEKGLLKRLPCMNGKMNLVNAEELLEKWDNLSKRGRTEFDQVIMTMPVVYDTDEVIKQIKEIGNKVCDSVECDKNCRDCDHGCLMRGILEVVKGGGIGETNRCG